MWGNWGHGKRASKIDEAIGWNNLGNVNWRDPLEAAGTILWVFLTLTAIIWVPVTLFTGLWLVTALLGFIWFELQPPPRPYAEMDQDLPASTLGRTPEAIYADQLAEARHREGEVHTESRARKGHLW
jgi:hypothetical protein